MTDITTREPLKVLEDGPVGPYLELPVDQVPRVCELLADHRVAFTVDEWSVSLDGEPPVVMIDFGRRGDAAAIQALLDSMP